MNRVFPAAFAAILALFVVGHSAANETDQFLLPADAPMADVGRWISATHCRVLERAAERANQRIRDAYRIQDPVLRETRLHTLRDRTYIAGLVREEFGPGFFETLGLERVLRTDAARRALGPGRLIFKRSDWIYSFAHWPIDPRNIPLLVPSSTIRVYGVHLGTDKLGHFHDLGHFYLRDYESRVRRGMDPDRAIREVVQTYSRGIISETGVVGHFATGVLSNADLAANYMGFRFYVNLTEPVILKGIERPPLMLLVGGLWVLNTHVRPDSDFFEPFVSDHWNEALNPCVYESGLRNSIARTLRKRSDEVLAFQCDIDGRPRDPAYFRRLAVELSTFAGEEYGYIGDPETIMSIGTACEFGEIAEAANSPDELSRTK